MGRKTEYEERFHPQLAKYMARCGLSDKEIAENLGISKATLNRWKTLYPEFRDSLKENKLFIDALVEDSLLKKAIGYNIEETEVIASADGKSKRIKKTKKWVHDTTAAIFWLKNRLPDRWRDTQNIQHGGSVGATLDLSYMSDEELRKELSKYSKNISIDINDSEFEKLYPNDLSSDIENKEINIDNE